LIKEFELGWKLRVVIDSEHSTDSFIQTHFAEIDGGIGKRHFERIGFHDALEVYLAASDIMNFEVAD